MQELEKILEEIEAEFDKRINTQLKIMAGLGDDVYRYGYGKSLEAYQQGKLLVTEIIRKHMNEEATTNDLISRQALLDDFRHTITGNSDTFDWLNMIARQPAVDKDDGWIPVEDRLPEEKVNSVSQDFCEYQVTAIFEGLLDVRHYKYGRGHWWNGPGIVDKYVIAWRERPDPYYPKRRRK